MGMGPRLGKQGRSVQRLWWATMPEGPEVDAFTRFIAAFAAFHGCPVLIALWYYRPDTGWNNQYLDLDEPKKNLIPWRDHVIEDGTRACIRFKPEQQHRLKGCVNRNKLFAIPFTSGLVLIVNPMKVGASPFHQHCPPRRVLTPLADVAERLRDERQRLGRVRLERYVQH
jgi:hypothetical protein